MRTYALRRLLLMIPTFFGISLLIFLVLNLAPGRPGGQSQGTDVATDARGAATQQSFKIFREQFNLDKPILFNTRFALTTPELRSQLELVAQVRDGSIAERIAAQETLEDLGGYAVPHFMAVMNAANSAGQLKLRDTAAYFLRLNAPRRLKNPFDPAPTPQVRAHNDEVAAERAALSRLDYAFEDSEVTKQKSLAGWRNWYERVQARFEYSTLDKFEIFFFDTRFSKYWHNLIRLDFGISLVSREPVMGTLLSKLKYSLSLSVLSLVLAYAIAIPLGVFSAVNKDSGADKALTLGLFMLYSLPSFFVATLLLLFFSLGSDWPLLRLFPTGGFQSLNYAELTFFGKIADVAWHLVLPLGCLTYGSLAALSRYMRTGLLEVIGADYIRTARAKGLPESVVIGKHALRNGLLPIITLLAGLLPAVLGGSVIIEYIFGIPGLGQWSIESIYQRDYNVIMGVQLLTSVLTLLGILFTDLAYALVDPRIRYQ